MPTLLGAISSVSLSASLADPLGSSPLTAAVVWLQATLLGTIATTIAVIAVAFVGVMMLLGRVDFRHGATVICGCFILFGATSIVAGLQSAVAISDSGYVRPAAPDPPPPPPPTAADEPYDPYAGASVPAH